MRVGLLVVGHVDPKSVHIAGDYPELFDALLGAHGIEVVPYRVDEGQLPQSVRECAGWVCSPSRASVYDDLPWIADAEALLREMLATETPFVGICFGHQLLAQVLGTPVQRAPGGWEVGAHTYEIVGCEPWMVGSDRELRLLASHQDQVTALPRDARLLARSASGACPIAGMAVGEQAWTLQPHPEFVAPLADHLLAGRVELIGAEKVSAARATLASPLDQSVVGAWIARFLGAG